MSLPLKDYQDRVLDSLRVFCRQCAKDGHPDAAFQNVLVRNGREPEPYVPVPAAGLAPGMPYVCLRVPTGGGKTLLGCYASGVIMKDFLHAERAVILWLVPSMTILDQTADALRNPRHDYRRALEMACGAVEVVTIEEALRLSRAVVDGQTVVIVSTIQAFKAEDTTGRKVYAQNGSFSAHMENIPSDRLSDLLPGADGKPLPSLVNMLRLRRPIVIVDEAHNARTPLSFDMLGNVLPSCIVEFTATPARKGTPSNVLHHVSAAELKAAEMIKLPLRVVTRGLPQADQLLSEALSLRASLEKLALAEGQQSGEYIRPILLLQAERVDACEPLRDRLVAEFGIAKDDIKISVGTLDELKEIKDVSAATCSVRVIITVQKLREGWDCPFAYVLCSLKETRSATAIEQIVGRILRLPQARLKQHPDLNCSYAFSVSSSLPAVLNELREALESNGFTAAEAQRIILPVSTGPQPTLISQVVQLEPKTELNRAAVDECNTSLANKVRVDAKTGTVTILVPLDADETGTLARCACTEEGKKKLAEAAECVRELDRAYGGTGQPRSPSGYETGAKFVVPRLCIREGTGLFEFEKTYLLEREWKLSAKDATLPATYDPAARQSGRAGLLDVGRKGEVQTSELQANAAADFVRNLHQQVLSIGGSGDWTVEQLVSWLDGHIEHRDIPAGESGEFLRKVVRGLMTKSGISDVGVLVLDRFRLRDIIEERIDEHRDEERKKAFQACLFQTDSPVEVGTEIALDFARSTYEPSWLYEGGFRFTKHYFGPKPGELKELTPSGKQTEEFRCAQYIDGLAQVKYWVRNLPRRTTSFRLHTSRDWFYPDFVCQLQDGRILVVEYKGEHLYDSKDSEEKRAVGEVWAKRSNGRCLFVMPTAGEFKLIEKVISGGK